jgi:hypothetical protein
MRSVEIVFLPPVLGDDVKTIASLEQGRLCEISRHMALSLVSARGIDEHSIGLVTHHLVRSGKDLTALVVCFLWEIRPLGKGVR